MKEPIRGEGGLRYETVIELSAAFKRGALVLPLVLDNDTTDAWKDVPGEDQFRRVFSMHPGQLLRALLDHAEIPWEEC